MNTSSENPVEDLLRAVTEAWKSGDGEKYASYFTKDAHYVVFDGTILVGIDAIGLFHQRAFDSHLAGTTLTLTVDGCRPLGDQAFLIFTSGGIQSEDGSPISLSGKSLQMMVVVLDEGEFRIDAFQNTRKRPITGALSVEVWKEFDGAWERCGEKQNEVESHDKAITR